MIGSEMPLTINTMEQDGYQTENRDPCASPPCKRLKQSSIPFQIIINDDTGPGTKQKGLSTCDSKETTEEIPSTIHKDNTQCDNSNEKLSSGQAPMEVEETNNKLSHVARSNTENLKTNSQPSANDVSLEEKKDEADGTSNNNNENKSKVVENKNGILKFMQPVTPGNQQPRNISNTTPSKNVENGASETPFTPNNGVTLSKTPPNTLPELESQTPKGRTPVQKLSVGEKLKREEERVKRQQEREKQQLEKKQERERLKMEKEKERQEMKQKKDQDKAEQLALKKQRDTERQEKKGQEEKERREKHEKREEEKRKKDDERKRKEDEKNVKNEEKRKKEEGEALKKAKVKNTFASFFIKKETTLTIKREQVKAETKFQPFELKPFMKLASTKPVIPLSEEAKKTLTDLLTLEGVPTQDAVSINCIKEELQKIRLESKQEKENIDLTQSNITKENNNDDDIMIVEDTPDTEVKKEPVKGIKAKLLQFHENHRPAYFGTWRKKSSQVGPRAPFKKDKDFDYEVDSDEEWEEEEPGESLSNSEGEEDGDEEKDEVDGENDGFFVPHGYLSDDEGVGVNHEDEMECNDGENPTTQIKTEDRMERQLAKQKQWEVEMRRRFKPMKPVAIGCIWNYSELPAVLKQLEACCLVPGNIIDVSNDLQETSSPSTTTTSSATTTAMPVPEEAMPALIKLVHGNTDGLHKLIMLFRKQWTLETKKDCSVSESKWEDHCPISKRQLERRITNIARKEKRPVMPKARWYVDDNVLTKYKMEDILLPNAVNSDNLEEQSLSNKVRGVTPTIKQFAQTSRSPGGFNKVENMVTIVKHNVTDMDPV